MPDRVHLLLTLPDVLLAYQSTVSESTLRNEVQALRQALDNPRHDPRPAAQILYQQLIAPITADLEKAGVKTLMVSLDDALRYIPLATLHDGEHYLVERYALTVFTDVARGNLEKRLPADWEGVGLGVSQAHEGFSALPTVPAELAGIIRDESAKETTGILPGRRFLDAQFTPSILREYLGSPVVHIASHFRLQPGNESMSYLLLGDNTHLELR
jgi:CHAT domain-containing protein